MKTFFGLLQARLLLAFTIAQLLPLVKGDNDLWLAVSENFGGWGVKAAFENMDHIESQK